MNILRDIADEIRGKKVLTRVDFNVPMDKETGRITNDLRIRQALPTIEFAVEHGARLILMSHLGRPKGKPDSRYSLRKVADRLAEFLGKDVGFASDCVGPEAEKAAAALSDGDVLMLENVRFHPEEEENDPRFARKLASLGDYYVSDAFGTVHRAHASTAGVADYLPACAGFLVERELQYLARATESPERPFVSVMGGAKISSKMGCIQNLLNKADTMLVGGAMTYTFMRRQGKSVGDSLVEEEMLSVAGELLEQNGDKIVLPRDHRCAAEIKSGAEVRDVGEEIPPGLIALDIGPKTMDLYESKIRQAKLVVWTGPMGYFEFDEFAEGCRRVAHAMADSEAVTVVGGGETGEVVEKLGLLDRMSHVSTGGGASLAFLSGEALPGITALG